MLLCLLSKQWLRGAQAVAEGYISLQRAQKEEASVAHRGLYSFKIDACEALNPYDSEVAHFPELISVATTNSVQLPLSDSTAASVGCERLPSS